MTNEGNGTAVVKKVIHIIAATEGLLGRWDVPACMPLVKATNVIVEIPSMSGPTTSGAFKGPFDS